MVRLAGAPGWARSEAVLDASPLTLPAGLPHALAVSETAAPTPRSSLRLRLDHVSHHYGATFALDDIALTLEPGEVVALVGSSGCGKSTLLNILGGLLQPSQGRVTMEGAPPADCLNPLTYVFQDFALLPWRSVAGNISLVLEDRLRDKAARRERVGEVLRLTGLTDFADAYPKQLSGGMRQRVGIARALAVSPGLPFHAGRAALGAR